MKSILKITSLLILLLPFSCRKDEVKISVNDEFEKYSKLIESNALVVVQNPDGQPIKGAQMLVDSKTYVSNTDGLIFLDKLPLKNTGHLVFLSHPEFFKTPKRIYPSKGVIYLTMIPLGTAKQFNTQNSAVVEFEGVTYNFPPHSVKDNSGHIYNGDVVIYSKRLNPQDPKFGPSMPSDLRAFDNNGKSVTLSSYGMVATELFSSQGVQLNVAEGAKVKISMKLDPLLSQSAPLNIPIWSLSEKEENGVWKEEGSAYKELNNYTFEVSHFSFWNCDVPRNYVNLQGRVLDQNKNPLQNLGIKVTVSGTAECGYAETNSSGWFGGIVPAGVDLKLEISMLNCQYTVFYKMDLGVLNTNLDLGEIIVSPPTNNAVIVKGKVEACNPFSLTSTVVKISINHNTQFISVDNAGNFASVNSCVIQGDKIDIQIFDYLNFKESDIISNIYTGNGTIDVGTIVPCNQLSEYFTISVDAGVEEILIDSVFLLDTFFVDSIHPNLKLHRLLYNGLNVKGIYFNVEFRYEFPILNATTVTSSTTAYYSDWIHNLKEYVDCNNCSSLIFTEYQIYGGYISGNYSMKSINGVPLSGRFRLKI